MQRSRTEKTLPQKGVRVEEDGGLMEPCLMSLWIKNCALCVLKLRFLRDGGGGRWRWSEKDVLTVEMTRLLLRGGSPSDEWQRKDLLRCVFQRASTARLLFRPVGFGRIQTRSNPEITDPDPTRPVLLMKDSKPGKIFMWLAKKLRLNI